MTQAQDTVVVHVNVELSTYALQTIVKNAKESVGPDEKGHYRVDTADKVGELISRFLADKGFNEYVADPDKYR